MHQQKCSQKQKAVLQVLIFLVCLNQISCATNENVSQTKSHGTERTLVLLKPDAVVRGHVGVSIASFEQCGLNIENLRVFEKVPMGTLQEHYKEHLGKSFYDELLESMSAGPVVAIQLRGENVVARIRALLGATDPSKAAPGTLRQKYGLDKTRNFAHASDSVESAERELRLWFGDTTCPAPA